MTLSVPLGRLPRTVAVQENVVGATVQNILRMSVGEKWSGERFRRMLNEAFVAVAR